MKASLIASSLAHVAVLGVAVFGLPLPNNLEAPPPETLPIDLVSVEEFTRLQKGQKDAPRDQPAAVKPPEKPKEAEKPQEKPAEKVVEKKEPPKAEPAPAPKAEPKPEPEPEPKPLVQPKPEPEPEPVQEAEKAPEEPPLPNFEAVAPPKRKPEPRREVAEQPRPTPTPAQETQSKFSSDRVAALLNKLPDAPQGPQDPADTAATPGFGLDRGTDETLSMDEIAYLRSQISRCWNPPVGAANAENLVVAIYFELNRDGSVAGSPRVTDAPPTQLGQIAAESARRAVELCQPYALPPQKYDLWQAIELNFDPKFMFGG